MNLDEARYTVVVANNPRFLFNRLRKNSAVESVANSNSAEEIANWLQQWSHREPTSVDDLAEAYVYLVALSFKENQGRQIARTLRLPGLPWSEYLIDMVAESDEPTGHVFIDQMIPLRNGVITTSASGDSYTILSNPVNP